MLYALFIILLIISNLFIYSIMRKWNKIKQQSVVNEPDTTPLADMSWQFGEIEPANRTFILIVESEPETCDKLAAGLSGEYRINFVSLAEHAVTLAKILSPTLILANPSPPDMSGDDLCRKLQMSIDTDYIPVVYLTMPVDVHILRIRMHNILQNRQIAVQKLIHTSAELHTNNANTTGDRNEAFMKKVLEVVHKNLPDSEFSSSTFYKELAMSRTSAFNKIKSLTGQNPNELIRTIRLQQAKELLETTSYTVSEVATMVGFADPKYFSTAFKRQYNMNPSKLIQHK